MKFKRRDYKYQLTQDETQILSFSTGVFYDHDWIKLEDNKITGVRGYAWDGCSGPTWDDKTNMLAGLIHDMGYQLIRMGVLPEHPFKELFDAEFKRICIERGMWRPRANYYYWGVSRFGHSSATGPEPEEIEV